jgi:beta-lactamase regulating signal transducer with metallopeptidase domain
MHTFLTAGMLLIVVFFTSHLMLGLLRPVEDWKKRRVLQLLILVLPMTSLFVLLGGLQHVLDPHCIQTVPVWDHVLDIGGVILLLSSIVGSVVLGLVRLFLMNRILNRQATTRDSCLEMWVTRLAATRGIGPVCVRLVSLSRPLALISGFRQPTLHLSTWMIEHLDQEELEAVLTHELVHVHRADYLINWIALMMRDAFFYLPPIRVVYRQMQREKELACDDLVAQITKRPLALASALAKVWQNLVETPRALLAQTLIGKGEGIEGRVERLLSPTLERRDQQQPFLFLQRMTFTLSVLFLVVVMSLMGMMVELFCWPTLPRLL